MDIVRRNNVTASGPLAPAPVLLYAHGFGCSQQMWSRVTPAFEDSHRQVLFDYVGSGASDRGAFNEQRYGQLTGYAQDVIDVCDALGLQEGVIFVGHSVSCSIGILASLARPRLFERLILVGPSPCFVNEPPDYRGGFERADLEGLLTLMDQNYMGWAQYLAPVLAGAGGGEPVSTQLSASFCSTDPTVTRVFARATFFADNRDDLPRVRVPSLILQHRTDTLAPMAVGEYMHRHLRGSTLQVLDVDGHCGHMSHPALIVDAMRRYLAPSVVHA